MSASGPAIAALIGVGLRSVYLEWLLNIVSVYVEAGYVLYI